MKWPTFIIRIYTVVGADVVDPEYAYASLLAALDQETR
jgi:hypothetical protein